MSKTRKISDLIAEKLGLQKELTELDALIVERRIADISQGKE